MQQGDKKPYPGDLQRVLVRSVLLRQRVVMPADV